MAAVNNRQLARRWERGGQMIDLPWQANPSRQVEGRISEKKTAKEFGARLHPNSGAGKIKFDFSNEDTIFEHKDAAKSHSLNAAVLLDLFRHSARQGKSACYVVQFENGIRLVGYLERGNVV